MTHRRKVEKKHVRKVDIPLVNSLVSSIKRPAGLTLLVFCSSGRPGEDSVTAARMGIRDTLGWTVDSIVCYYASVQCPVSSRVHCLVSLLQHLGVAGAECSPVLQQPLRQQLGCLLLDKGRQGDDSTRSTTGSTRQIMTRFRFGLIRGDTVILSGRWTCTCLQRRSVP